MRGMAATILSESGSELEWLSQIGQQIPSDADSTTVVACLLQASAEHLACTAAWLVRPNVPAVAVRSEGGDARWHREIRKMEAPLLKHAQEAWCRDSGPGAMGTMRCGFRILVMPLASRVAPGVLLFLRSPDMPAFSSAERHVVRLLGRQAASLLESQLDLATGLYTRHVMQTLVERWGSRGTHAGEHSIICVNIDRLHVINETAGFEVGDRVIAEVARLLQPARLPQNAVSARIGGNEFAVALPHTDVRIAEYLARALQASAAAIGLRLPDPVGPVSLSCGIASFIDPQAEFAHALTLAEVACNTAKDRGRGRVELYSEADSSMVRRRTDAMTLGRLREALRNDRLTLYAQKIVPLSSEGGHIGYELLLRDPDDTEQTCAPAWLFSAAQRYQFESTVDLWVIEHAIRTASRYRSELFNAQVSLSINISGRSLLDEVLMERVKGWIRQSRLAPGLLTFELIETAALSSIARAAAFIRELRKLGCRFALDDFGVGVNSLQYLKTLGADRVKIDGSFVTDVLTNPQSEATIRAITHLAREMRVETVAECAENEATVRRLRQLGVDYVQGYALHRPRPFEEVLQSLRAEESARRHIGLEN